MVCLTLPVLRAILGDGWEKLKRLIHFLDGKRRDRRQLVMGCMGFASQIQSPESPFLPLRKRGGGDPGVDERVVELSGWERSKESFIKLLVGRVLPLSL